MPITNVRILDQIDPIEVVLELNSFSGGENTRGSDSELKNNEARIIQNWDAKSIGGMIRSKGFNEVADGGVTYTGALDLLIQHAEGSSNEIYGIIEGDLVKKASAVIVQDDAAAFTTGVLSHGVSAGGKLFVTNETDNLQVKTIGVATAATTDQPSSARARIYEHKFRLVAEGGGVTVFGSRAGSGNFNVADTWSLANDAWNIDLPNDTQGCIPGFPSGNELLVFTKYGAFVIWNFPDVTYRPIEISHGCSAPYALAKGNEGVFLVSEYPKKGVFLWDRVNWIELTQFHTFHEEIDFSKRIFGIYRNREYHLFYNKTGSGVTYPNVWRIYSTEFGRWMERPINSLVSDTFGYPALLRFTTDEFYVGSSQKDLMYELQTTDNSDEGQETEANFKTKDFTSVDFTFANGGGQFSIDEARMKLIKVTASFFAISGTWTLQWTADRGAVSGSQTFTVDTSGAKLNDDFTVNTSKILSRSSIPDRTVTKTFNNSAIGTRFNFQIINRATGERLEIKKIKIHATILDEE